MKTKNITLDKLTPNEIIDRLMNHEKVYASKLIYYKMVKNQICRYNKDICTAIGVALALSKEYYFIEEDSIILEVNKLYKTRDGEKVICFNYVEEDPFPYKIVKLFSNTVYSVSKDGTRYKNLPTDEDIVDYWKD